MSATTSKLNYAAVPPRATSSRSLRNEVVPSNGSSFNCGNSIIFDLPSNVPNTFFDTHSSYVSMLVSNTDGHYVKFSGNGFPAAIRRLTIELGGQTIMSLDHYGELYSAMMDLDASSEFKINAGSVLFGSNNNLTGEVGGAPLVANTGSRRVCFPLFLTPLMANKYFPSPMSRDRMRIRLEMDTAVRGFVAENTGVLNTDITFSDVKFVQYSLELGSEIMAQVAAAAGGSFKVACPCYQHHQSSMAAGASSISPTLGFSMSSLNRVLILQQLQADTATAETIGNRLKEPIERVSISVGGVKYPQLDMKISTDGSEALAEALVSQRALTSVSTTSSINAGGVAAANDKSSPGSYAGLVGGTGNNGATGATAALTGKFLIDLDLESQRAGAAPESQLVAGVNTIGSVVQAKLDYSSGTSAATVINFYGEFTLLLMLDLNTLTFSVAV